MIIFYQEIQFMNSTNSMTNENNSSEKLFLTHILKFKKSSNDINDKQIPPCTFPNDSR